MIGETKRTSFEENRDEMKKKNFSFSPKFIAELSRVDAVLHVEIK